MADKLETRGGGGGEKRKGKDFVQTKNSKNFLKGFWCPTHGGNLYVLVSKH